MAEPLIHENGDGIDFEALRTPAEGAVGWRIAPTDYVHPERLLGRWLEQVDLNIETVLLGTLLHPCQRTFDHLSDGWDFHPRVGAENGDRFFRCTAGTERTASKIRDASIVLSLPPLNPTSHGRLSPK